jgi:hypothetical protein
MAVIRALWLNESLKQLVCTGNPLGRIDGGIPVFAQVPPKNLTLKFLNLDGCDLQHEGCQS